ncbi:MAG: hypothetical protein HY827_03560 [Actinobacteria bacterium]|nr:hypothetical protein [Actinomycetota bacterium]
MADRLAADDRDQVLTNDQIEVRAGKERLIVEPCNICANERGDGCTLKGCPISAPEGLDLLNATVNTAVPQRRVYVRYSGTRGRGATYLRRATGAKWDLGRALRGVGEIQTVQLIARTGAGDYRDYEIGFPRGGGSAPSFDAALTL